MARTVVGIFDTFVQGHQAVEQLVSAGYDRGQISVIHNRQRPAGGAMADRMDADAAAARTGVTPDWGMSAAGSADAAGSMSAIDADPQTFFEPGVKLGAGTGAAAGAGTGAVVGGGLGLLAGAIGLFIPGLGAILGMGPVLATILGGAGIGAVAGGLSGALVNAGIPTMDADNYAEGVRRGGTLVTVVADDDLSASHAASIFQRLGAFNINERAATWSEATGPIGGNIETPALSTLPDSSMTAERPVSRV